MRISETPTYLFQGTFSTDIITTSKDTFFQLLVFHQKKMKKKCILCGISQKSFKRTKKIIQSNIQLQPFSVFIVVSFAFVYIVLRILHGGTWIHKDV